MRQSLARFVTSAWLLGALAAAGCGEERQAATSPAAAPSAPAAVPAAVDAEAEAEARRIFAQRCVTCHGPEGAGDGPASAGLTPTPRNFRDPEWQASVTDAHIEKIVLYGGAAVGRSPAMPANPDLVAKRPVLLALRQHIRGLVER